MKKTMQLIGRRSGKLLFKAINFYKPGKLPDFVIIGAQKCGTSSLHKNLRKHPQISVSLTKELHFFDINWSKGVAWYKKNFQSKNKKCGEATPEYIYFTQYHKRIFETIPEAKLILALRNPVTRAYSQWNHYKNTRFKNMSFEEIVKRDLDSLQNEPKVTDLIKRGFYINQIESLLKYYPREQLHIVISERNKNNSEKEYNKIFEFLGVRKKSNIRFAENVHKRTYTEPIKPETAKYLYELYKTYNEKLFEFLGYRVSEWDNT